MRLLYIITDLRSGGAESMLKNIALLMSKENQILVVSLKGDGHNGSLMRDAGINVHVLGLHSWINLTTCFIALYNIIQKFKPDIVHTWLYHSDLIGGLAAYLNRVPTIIWSIRSSNFITPNTSWKIKLIIWVCAKLSWILPHRIQSCSLDGIRVHHQLGYKQDLFEYIPNGVDVCRFSPDIGIRKRERLKLKIPDDCFVVLMVARYDPVKNHSDFLKNGQYSGQYEG